MELNQIEHNKLRNTEFPIVNNHFPDYHDPQFSKTVI